MSAVRNALKALPFPLRLQPFRPPPGLLRKPDALRLPLGRSPLLLRGVTARGRRRVSPTWVLVRSLLPPPAVRWERRAGGHKDLSFCGCEQFVCFLPPGGEGSGIIAFAGVSCAR